MAKGDAKNRAPAKFKDPFVTADGAMRASVTMQTLRRLWFNTGTLCNLTCTGCYVESSPSNDRLVYLTRDDVAPFFDEIDAAVDIGFTGGEPFLNPHIIELLGMALSLGHRVIVQTNAMHPMMRPRMMEGLIALMKEHGDRLTLQVSLDQPEMSAHDVVRGAGAFEEAATGIDWLIANDFDVRIAGRKWGADEAGLRQRYDVLFRERDWTVDALSTRDLELLPEMEGAADAPEVATDCWDLFDAAPDGVMCASSRMVMRRAGAARASVAACKLVPFDPAFELGETLADSASVVQLNHPHCAQFCVMGGGHCAR